MSERKQRKEYNVSAEKFVETWNAVAKRGGNAQEVADLLGMPKNLVLARKSNYTKPRKDGSPGVKLLPIKKRNPRKLNIENLNEIASKAAEVEETTE